MYTQQQFDQLVEGIQLYNISNHSTDPYRNYDSHPVTENVAGFTEIKPEMVESVILLHKLRKYKPVIAGGALWSWAAMKLAKDVDIFLEDRWFSRRAVRKIVGQSCVTCKDDWKVIGTDSYGYAFSHTVKSNRCMYQLPLTKRPVDLVLSRWSGIESVKHFDYYHCMVGFGIDEVIMNGAPLFGAGTLSRNDSQYPRDEKLMEWKVSQNRLWGDPRATDKMETIMRTLRVIYNAVSVSGL